MTYHLSPHEIENHWTDTEYFRFVDAAIRQNEKRKAQTARDSARKGKRRR